MINSITTKFFETHLNTELFFHQGTNVIIGESDEGKSGIVRQIEWNAFNRPQGDGYRNDKLNPKKKEDKLKITEVAIDYKDAAIITRARDGFAGGINHYQINDEEPLRALKTDVPDEVKEITRMKSINVQGQHPTEQYFLLADNPGQVAKKFNKVAGLTIMDDAIKSINAQVRSCNASINNFKEQIEEKEAEIEDTKWVESASKLAKKLLKFKKELAAKDLELEELSETIRLLNNLEFQLTAFYGIDEAMEALKTLKNQQQKINDKENTLNSILKLIASIKSVDSALKNSSSTTNALNALNKLKTLSDDIKEYENNIAYLESILFTIKDNEKQCKMAESEFKKAKKIHDKIRKEVACPVCGRKG